MASNPLMQIGVAQRSKCFAEAGQRGGLGGEEGRWRGEGRGGGSGLGMRGSGRDEWRKPEPGWAGKSMHSAQVGVVSSLLRHPFAIYSGKSGALVGCRNPAASQQRSGAGSDVPFP